MSNPFEIATVDFAPAGQKFAERLTVPQRKALMAMGTEKAELLGLDLEQARDQLDEWLKDMSKETAGRAITKLGRWLDTERAKRGLSRNR